MDRDPNFEARNNLRAMGVGDLCLFYHSVEAKAVVGIARVSRAARPDPTAPGEDWASVEVEAVEPLPAPVTLERIRADARLQTFQLLTRGRLSVVPATAAQYARVLALSRMLDAPPPRPGQLPGSAGSAEHGALRRPHPVHALEHCGEQPSGVAQRLGPAWPSETAVRTMRPLA